jgi:TPP-dependent pyruvate/acetoin dehydrogenase alpha subunit
MKHREKIIMQNRHHALGFSNQDVLHIYEVMLKARRLDERRSICTE